MHATSVIEANFCDIASQASKVSGVNNDYNWFNDHFCRHGIPTTLQMTHIVDVASICYEVKFSGSRGNLLNKCDLHQVKIRIKTCHSCQARHGFIDWK